VDITIMKKEAAHATLTAPAVNKSVNVEAGMREAMADVSTGGQENEMTIPMPTSPVVTFLDFIAQELACFTYTNASTTTTEEQHTMDAVPAIEGKGAVVAVPAVEGPMPMLAPPSAVSIDSISKALSFNNIATEEQGMAAAMPSIDGTEEKGEGTEENAPMPTSPSAALHSPLIDASICSSEEGQCSPVMGVEGLMCPWPRPLFSLALPQQRQHPKYMPTGPPTTFTPQVPAEPEAEAAAIALNGVAAGEGIMAEEAVGVASGGEGAVTHDPHMGQHTDCNTDISTTHTEPQVPSEPEPEAAAIALSSVAADEAVLGEEVVGVESGSEGAVEHDIHMGLHTHTSTTHTEPQVPSEPGPVDCVAAGEGTMPEEAVGVESGGEGAVEHDPHMGQHTDCNTETSNAHTEPRVPSEPEPVNGVAAGEADVPEEGVGEESGGEGAAASEGGSEEREEAQQPDCLDQQEEQAFLQTYEDTRRAYVQQVERGEGPGGEDEWGTKGPQATQTQLQHEEEEEQEEEEGQPLQLQEQQEQEAQDMGREEMVAPVEEEGHAAPVDVDVGMEDEAGEEEEGIEQSLQLQKEQEQEADDNMGGEEMAAPVEEEGRAAPVDVDMGMEEEAMLDQHHEEAQHDTTPTDDALFLAPPILDESLWCEEGMECVASPARHGDSGEADHSTPTPPSQDPHTDDSYQEEEAPEEVEELQGGSIEEPQEMGQEEAGEADGTAIEELQSDAPVEPSEEHDDTAREEQDMDEQPRIDTTSAPPSIEEEGQEEPEDISTEEADVSTEEGVMALEKASPITLMEPHSKDIAEADGLMGMGRGMEEGAGPEVAMHEAIDKTSVPSSMEGEGQEEEAGPATPFEPSEEHSTPAPALTDDMGEATSMENLDEQESFDGSIVPSSNEEQGQEGTASLAAIPSVEHSSSEPSPGHLEDSDIPMHFTYGDATRVLEEPEGQHMQPEGQGDDAFLDDDDEEGSDDLHAREGSFEEFDAGWAWEDLATMQPVDALAVVPASPVDVADVEGTTQEHHHIITQPPIHTEGQQEAALSNSEEDLSESGEMLDVVDYDLYGHQGEAGWWDSEDLHNDVPDDEAWTRVIDDEEEEDEEGIDEYGQGEDDDHFLDDPEEEEQGEWEGGDVDEQEGFDDVKAEWIEDEEPFDGP
jgi:hypothetical protein